MENKVFDVPLSQRVAEMLEEKILNGFFKPGQRLYEIEIANDFNLSRSPIREAFYLLANKGIVKMIPRKGVFITKPTHEGLEQILDLRSAIDGLAARLAARNASKEIAETLYKITVDQNSAAIAENKQLFKELGLQFHMEMYSATKNPKLKKIAEDLTTEAVLYRIFDISIPGAMIFSANEHILIAEAIKMKDEELAYSRAQVHIETVRNRLKSQNVLML